jgi:hypothetical protein
MPNLNEFQMFNNQNCITTMKHQFELKHIQLHASGHAPDFNTAALPCRFHALIGTIKEPSDISGNMQRNPSGSKIASPTIHNKGQRTIPSLASYC